MPISSVWTVQRRPVSQLFYNFGIHCATHQIRVILICGFVITSLFYPALAIYFSHQPLSHFSTRILDSLFFPLANDAFHDNDLHDLWQGYDALRIRTDAATRARCGTEHTIRVERLFIPSVTPDPFGPLNAQTLISTLGLQLELEKSLTPELPCVRLLDDATPSTPLSRRCLVVSPTTYWGDDPGLIAAEPRLYESLNAHRNISRGGIPLTAEMMLAGRLTTDHAGYGSIIESSKFLCVTFFFRENDCHSNAGHNTWLDLVRELASPAVEVHGPRDQPKLLALEFAALPRPYSPWVSIGLCLAYLVLFVQLSGSMRRMDSVHSRFGLTFTGMIEILASTITSVSVCAIAGFRVTMVPWGILPIVIVIVGAENMFVLMEAVLATPISLPVRRRIAEGLQKAGVSITLKVTTYNAVLGAIGYFASGAIRQFCVFAIVVLVAHWFLIHTFFLAVLSIDLQRLELSEMLRQGASSPGGKSERNPSGYRYPGSRFGIRMGFKTKAARNISLMLMLVITGGLYYFSGPHAASRLQEPIKSFGEQDQDLHHLTPTQSVYAPHTALSSSPQDADVPSTLALPSTPALIWRTLNPANDPLVHLRVETPTLVILPPPAGAHADSGKAVHWSHRIRQLRPILWTLKVLVLPIAATLGALYALLLHLLRNAELQAAQRDRIDSLNEDEAEERKREEERQRKELAEHHRVEASFSTLPRASKSDIQLIRCSHNGGVVAAVSAEGLTLVWSLDAPKSRSATSPTESSNTSTSEGYFGKQFDCTPMVIPVPNTGARVSSLGIDGNGKALAVASSGAVQLWDISRQYPLLGKRLVYTPEDTETSLGSIVRDIVFLRDREATIPITPPPASPGHHVPTQTNETSLILVAYEGGSVIEWNPDSGEMKQVVSCYGPGAQAAILLREGSVFVVFSYPDGHVEIQQRISGGDGSVSYTSLLSLKVPGVIAIDVCEWSLGLLVATLTSSGHAAVWDDDGLCVVEMDLGLLAEQQRLFSPCASATRVRILPTPPAPLPCRRCGLPPTSSFNLAFSWAVTPSCDSTVHVRRASVLYQTGRCSCQPLSIASILAGPRVISFGLHSGVRIVNGIAADRHGDATPENEFPVSVHGLRRPSSGFVRQSLDSNSSTIAEDPASEYTKRGSNGLHPISKENGLVHRPKSRSDVRWGQYAIEESCERGWWDIAGTHIVGIRRKPRPSKPMDEDKATRDISSKSQQLPGAVLERWEVWQVDIAAHDLSPRTSLLSKLREQSESVQEDQTSVQSDTAADSSQSVQMARIMRLGQAAGSRSSSLVPQHNGNNTVNSIGNGLYPRLPFTRVSSANASHSGLYAAFGNTVGLIQLDESVPSRR